MNNKKVRVRPGKYPSIQNSFIAITLLAIAPALLIILLSGLEYGKTMEDRVIDEARRQAEALAAVQDGITAGTAQLLASLAALPEFEAMNQKQMTRILKAVHQTNPDYLNFTAVDIEGRVVASSLLPVGYLFTGRRHIDNAISHEKFTAGEYILAAVEAEPSLPFAYPLRDANGQIQGALTAVYTLNSYKRLMKRLNIPEGAFIGLVDWQGKRLFFYPQAETNPIGGPIKESVWQTIRDSQPEDVFSDTASDGVTRYFAARNLQLSTDPEPYIHIVYATPVHSVRAAIKNRIYHNLLLMSAIGGFAIMAVILLSRLLFGRRLDNIIRTANRFREGDNTARFDKNDNSPDLGQIAKALNAMAATIAYRDEERKVFTDRISRALAEKEVLLKEIHHRVKNNLQIILSLIRLQESSKQLQSVDIPETANPGLLTAMESRIAAMSLVHEMLYETENAGQVDLEDYADRIAALVGKTHATTVKLNSDTSNGSLQVELEQAVPFGLLLNELLTNAFKYAGKTGRQTEVFVHIKRETANRLYLRVSDNGPGFPADFNPENSSGLGLQLVNSLAAQLGGSLEWHSDNGAHFILHLTL